MCSIVGLFILSQTGDNLEMDQIVHTVFHQTSTDLNTMFFMTVGRFFSDFSGRFST